MSCPWLSIEFFCRIYDLGRDAFLGEQQRQQKSCWASSDDNNLLELSLIVSWYDGTLVVKHFGSHGQW